MDQDILRKTGGTSRTALRETAIGHRDGPRGANLRPKPPLLSHRELVSVHSVIRNTLKLTGLYWRARRNTERILVKRNDVIFKSYHRF